MSLVLASVLQFRYMFHIQAPDNIWIISMYQYLADIWFLPYDITTFGTPNND